MKTIYLITFFIMLAAVIFGCSLFWEFQKIQEENVNLKNQIDTINAAHETVIAKLSAEIENSRAQAAEARKASEQWKEAAAKMQAEKEAAGQTLLNELAQKEQLAQQLAERGRQLTYQLEKVALLENQVAQFDAENRVLKAEHQQNTVAAPPAAPQNPIRPDSLAVTAVAFAGLSGSGIALKQRYQRFAAQRVITTHVSRAEYVLLTLSRFGFIPNPKDKQK